MRWRDAIFVAGLVVSILLVYANSFPGEFHFDDYSLMLDNSKVTGVSFPPEAFLENYGGRPLTLWTFHWNYRWFEQNSLGYHATNVGLHVLASCLLFALISRELGRRWPAFLAVLVFGLHPLQTQAVNYIWSRSALLMFCFGLAALLLARRHSWWALVMLQLAVWSRTDGVVFLAPMIFLNRRFWKAPVVLAVVNAGVFAYFLAVYRPLEVGWTHPSVWRYWSTEAVVLWKYLGLVVWPASLTVDHDVLAPGVAKILLAVVGLALVAVLLWRTWKTHPAIAIGGAWFFLALAPAALIPNSDPLNESRAYPAVAGIALALAAVMSSRWAKPVAALVLVSLLALTPVTFARNQLWKDDIALWSDAVQKSPEKARAHYNLGVAWAREGRVEQAEQAFRRGLALDPEDDWSAAGLGYCAEFKQNLGQAERHYRQAVSLNTRNEYAQEGLARVQNRMSLPESEYNLEGTELQGAR